MSITRFCDICLNEIQKEEVSNEARVTHKTFVRGVDQIPMHLELKITRSLNGVSNAGDICKTCIRTAVNEGTMTKGVTLTHGI